MNLLVTTNPSLLPFFHFQIVKFSNFQILPPSILPFSNCQIFKFSNYSFSHLSAIFVTNGNIPASKFKMMRHNETELIGRILNGDVSGYAVLVNQYKDLSFTIAFRILGNREDSEEVIQDAFVKAFRSLSSFRQKSKFSTWLYRIVYNTAISRKRIKGIAFQSIEEMPFLDAGSESGEDPAAEQGQLLEFALKQLPEEDRAIITLYYLNESSVDEIHAITGFSRSNVKIKLFRARKKLQEIMSKSMVIFN